MQGSYTNLKAWQFGYTLALETYQSINTFPRNEKFGLISQMQRSAVSIPCNIAEGYARISQKKRFSSTLFQGVLLPSSKRNFCLQKILATWT
jgi:hypothetical protein